MVAEPAPDGLPVVAHDVWAVEDVGLVEMAVSVAREALPQAAGQNLLVRCHP